ncbi:MAG: hypothetical protein ACRD72_23275, partial [Candidatus Angelobacter sp.]
LGDGAISRRRKRSMLELQEFLRLLSDPRVLSNPEAAGPILVMFALLAIVACGFALMCSTLYAPLRQFSARCFVLGIFLVVAGGVVPGTLSTPAGGLPLFPDWVVAWFGVVGVSAFILGMKRAGLLLATPAASLFFAAPLLGPEWQAMPAAVRHTIPLLFLAFGGILVLKYIIQAIYGKEVAGAVAATYLVRLLDKIWRSIPALFGLPFRWWLRGRGD